MDDKRISVNVGATSEAVTQLEVTILSILNATHADEKTKRVALHALRDGLRVEHTMIRDCNFVLEGNEQP